MIPSVDAAAVHHAVDSEQIERCFLSVGFYDETGVAFASALAKQDLGVDDFLGPFHCEVAQALLGYAQAGEQPTLESVRAISESCGADWTIGDGQRLEVILDATCHANLIERYAEMMADAAERRHRARGLIDKAERLLEGDRLACPADTGGIAESAGNSRVHVPWGVRTAIRRRSRRA